MKKMTRNEFLKMAGTSAALVVFNTVLMPAAVAVEPGVVALSSKKSSIEIDKGTTVNSATFKLVPISRETFWGDAGSCTLDYLSEGYIQWTITVPGAVIVSFEGNLHFNKLGTPFGTFDHAISAYGTIGTEDVKYGLSKGKWEVEFTGIATAANGDMYSVVDGATLAFSVTKLFCHIIYVFDFYKIAYHIEQAPPAVDSSIWNIYCRWGF